MITNGFFTQDQFDDLSSAIQQKINQDWTQALSAEYPEKEFLLSSVYSK
jgi:TPP-dependent pyruvate/acetoin dehydrogenase alpha subunit